MTPGPSVDEYLDAIRYRRYSGSVLVERRRLLVVAASAGSDAWLMHADVDEVVEAVRATGRIRSRVNLHRLRSVLLDYRRWRAAREAA